MVSVSVEQELILGTVGKTCPCPVFSIHTSDAWIRMTQRQSSARSFNQSICIWPLHVVSHIRTALFQGCLSRANTSKRLSGSLLWFKLKSDTASLVPYSIDGNSQILPRSRWEHKDPNSWLKKYHWTGGHIWKLPQEDTGWMSILLLTETAVGCQFPPHHQVSCSLCWSEAKLSPSPNLASQWLWFYFQSRWQGR